MWPRVKRGTLWVAAVFLVSAGGGLMHSALLTYRQDPVETFVGLVCLLTGAAIYWHGIRVPRAARM